jgi:two-component system OmpR family response regulator
VLIVEDEATLSAVIKRNLEARRYRVRAVGSAEAAIDVALAERPAVLLLDVNLPERSGWDVLRELRARRRYVPTIVVSAVRPSQARLEEFRPEAHFLKPFPLSALLAAVERLCASGAAWQRTEQQVALERGEEVSR